MAVSDPPSPQPATGEEHGDQDDRGHRQRRERPVRDGPRQTGPELIGKLACEITRRALAMLGVKRDDYGKLRAYLFP
jgi:hypothetical protein